ncbi:MAG TPA: hypothetical protein VNK26_05640 [Pyrinomonadaceae bacterium]|nr:hypothetical protein [Pyrinomonadaceae bacterium]
MIKKTLLILFCFVLLLQIPFIYRRYEISKLDQQIKLNQEAGLSDQPQTEKAQDGFREYKGIIHAHTALGGHSTGTFNELLEAAESNRLDFVIMTEHYSAQFDTAALTLKGKIGNTLYVAGNEIDANDGGRFLLIPGSGDAAELSKMPTADVMRKIHSEGKIAVNNYPDRARTEISGFDGMEVYSLHINAKSINKFMAAMDFIWSFSSYPEATIASYFRRNDDYLSRFDNASQKSRIFLTAGSDAHSNRGYYLLADDEGHRLIGFKIDPYTLIFKMVRNHVLVENTETGTELTEASLLNAIKNGRLFIGFDVLGDTSGFRFTAENEQKKATMGDEIAGPNVILRSWAPKAADFRLLCNGEIIAETTNSQNFEYKADRSGVYRIEVYLSQLGENFQKTPWIISNPIYVR